MLPCEQLLAGVGAVCGQLKLEQIPVAHRLTPAARRSQSLAYDTPSQPQTGSMVPSQTTGFVMQLPTGATVGQAPGASSQYWLVDPQAVLEAPPHVELPLPAPPAVPAAPAAPLVPPRPVPVPAVPGPTRPPAPVVPAEPVVPAAPVTPP